MHPEVNVSVEQRRRWREDEKLSILGKVGLNGTALRVRPISLNEFRAQRLARKLSKERHGPLKWRSSTSMH
ncbi:hypothetical protein, partial [Sulfitobacter sp. Ks41]|uniref:hypothetical protein n=1 Tax=Sulfitobacter sp. Ks41 TaxID=2731139 RepID=UPI0023E3249A